MATKSILHLPPDIIPPTVAVPGHDAHTIYHIPADSLVCPHCGVNTCHHSLAAAAIVSGEGSNPSECPRCGGVTIERMGGGVVCMNWCCDWTSGTGDE